MAWGYAVKSDVGNLHGLLHLLTAAQPLKRINEGDEELQDRL